MIIDEGSSFLNLAVAQFNGVDERTEIAAPSFLTNAAGFISFWYRPTTVMSATGGRPILALGCTATNVTLRVSLRWAVSVGSTNRIEVLIRTVNGGGYTLYAAMTTAITAGNWYHVHIQQSGGSYEIRINGVGQTVTGWFSKGGGASPAWFNALSAQTSPVFTLGGAILGGVASYSDCRLDEVLIGNVNATADDVAWLYNSGVRRNPRKRPLGSHWYRMGDSRDNGTMLYDEIGPDNHTLVNMDSSNYVSP